MLFLYIALIITGFLLLLYSAGGLALAVVFYFQGKTDNDQVVEFEVKEKNLDIKLLDIPCKELYINSRFGYKLFARLYQSDTSTDKYIIGIHGKSSSSIGQLKYLKIFSEAGYNVLLPDQRNSGQSGKSFFSLGFYEKYDIISWITAIKRLNKNAEIILFGESMGGAAAILAAEADHRVKGVISYCSFSSVTDIIKRHLGNPYPPIIGFFIPAFIIVSLLCFGIKVWQLNIASKIRRVKAPALIIHSRQDKLIDISHARKLIDNCDKAEYIIFDKGEHAKAYCEQPLHFTQAVRRFLSKIK
jgi:pimeloyl-ACP methyl ester carboxylesterase